MPDSERGDNRLYQYNLNKNNILWREPIKMQTTTLKQELTRETKTFTRRIGSTTYRVGVHFSETSKETLNDKIMRLVRNDNNGKAVM